jgi:hypothetical protein
MGGSGIDGMSGATWIRYNRQCVEKPDEELDEE